MSAEPTEIPSTVPNYTVTDDDLNSLLDYFNSLNKTETDEGLLPSDRLRNVDFESFKPKLVPSTQPDTSRSEPNRIPIASYNAQTGFNPTEASHMLSAYAGLRVNPVNRMDTSSYVPSSIMMYHLVHIMNELMCASFDFRRTFPDYHPYYLRLYAGMLFWIQSARAASAAGILPISQRVALRDILASHPLESLPVPGPLIYVFKSLCASQPEFQNYGLVAPYFPPVVGPAARRNFTTEEDFEFLYPNITGIFTLIDDLRLICSQNPPAPPNQYQHIPVTAEASVFGDYVYPAADERTARQSWLLVSPGLEYPCEADLRMNMVFAMRHSSFGFPALNPNDNLNHLSTYLGMNHHDSWFSHLKNIAASISSAFTGSITLADCAPVGINANQYLTAYAPYPEGAVPAAPTQIAQHDRMFPLSIALSTSVRTPNPLSKNIACLAQTNVYFPDNHPYLTTLGAVATTRFGEFWSIRPNKLSNISGDAYKGIKTAITAMFDTSKF